MKKMIQFTLATTLLNVSVLAETNAHIEVKLFKDWVIKGERSFCNLSIKNTGTSPILLAENPADFSEGQLVTRPLSRNLAEDKEQERQYQLMLLERGEFLKLLPEETHVYEGRKFHLNSLPFSEEMHFTVSVYLGKGVWLDSEPLMVKGIVPESIEHMETISDANSSRDLVAVTYKNERWLYTKLGGYYPDFPLRAF
jgi:hypothetical protein